MIAAIARSFDNSPYEIVEEDSDSLLLARGNYLVHICKVGPNDLDVWYEGPYGDSDVLLTNPNGLDSALDDLYDESWADCGLVDNVSDDGGWI